MKTQQTLPQIIWMELPATFRSLSLLSSCIDRIIMQITDLEEQRIIIANVQLAVQELCTNIVRHAYEGQENNARIGIMLTLDETSHQLIIELRDKGRAFDVSLLAELRDKDHTSDAGLHQEPDLVEGQINGYGLYLINRLVDEVTYSRRPEGNLWRLVTKL